MKNLLLLGALAAYTMVHAQPEMSRMEKDIDVLEKVVNQLLKQDDHYYGSRSTDIAHGSYIPGFGVIMQVSGSKGNFLYSDFTRNIEVDVKRAMDESRKALKEMRIYINSDDDDEKGGKENKGDKKHKEVKDKKKVKEYKIVTADSDEDAPVPPVPPIPPIPPMPHAAPFPPGMPATKNVQVKMVRGDKQDSAFLKKQDFFMAKMKEALQNYADIITQLAPGEKILMVYDEQSSSSSMAFYNYGGKQVNMPKISAEVKKEDIDALRNGKINAKTFGERIKTEKAEAKADNAIDYKVFAGILETVLNNGSSFHVNNNIRYTALQDFGVIYYANMDLPYNRKTFVFFDDNDEHGDTAVKHDIKKLQAQQDEVVNTLKDNLLEYGRTIRNLKNDQYVMVDVHLPKQDTLPRNVSIRVKKDVLVKYDKGELTREKAMEMMNVAKN